MNDYEIHAKFGGALRANVGQLVKVTEAIEVHTFHVPLRRRVGNVLRALLILVTGH